MLLKKINKFFSSFKLLFVIEYHFSAPLIIID